MKYTKVRFIAALALLICFQFRSAEAVVMKSEAFKKVSEQIEVELARFRDLATVKNQMPENVRKTLMLSALNRGQELVDDLNPDFNPVEIKTLSSANLALSQATHLIESRNDYAGAAKILDRWFINFKAQSKIR